MMMLRDCLVLLFFCGYSFASEKSYGVPEERKNIFEYIVIIEPITEKIKQKIVGKSWLKECPVALEDLRYLSIPHWDWKGKIKRGELVVHEDVAEEVATIFKVLYAHNFRIEKMKLIDDYFQPGVNRDEVVDYSCADNNTYAFFYHKNGKTSFVSEHSYGKVIDINPCVNPLVWGDRVYPQEASIYTDRTRDNVPGLITKDSICYLAFLNCGWQWSGDWKNVQDYKRFFKKEN